MSRRVPTLVRAASRLALDWAGWYTRGLEPAVADDRRDEIASDVWEQTAGQADRPAFALAASIASRVVRGIPADLAWRRRSARPARAEGPARGPRWAVTIAVGIGGLGLATGIAALTHLAVGLARGEALPSPTTVASTAVGVVALVLGFALSARPRSRRLGLVWIAGGTGLAMHFGMLVLVTLSALVQQPYAHLLLYTGESWVSGWFLVVAAIAAFPALVAFANPSTTTLEAAPGTNETP